MDYKAKLKENMAWYYDNLESLLPSYRNRYVAFTEGKVVGVADEFVAAAQVALSNGYQMGHFAVHLCIPKSEEKPLVFNTRRADFSKVAL